jgi:uncharacterized membrane protein YebE (DUF533 family)
MFDAKKLLAQMFDVGSAPQAKGKFRTRADIQKHLGDDPFASVRGLARVAAGMLGPIPPGKATSTVAAWETSSPEQAHAILLLRAMIAAAKADGEVDPEERARIVEGLRAAGAEDNARRFVEEELAAPVDLYTITSEVRDAATAAEVYAASLAAIRVDTEAERRYLDNLALRLGLDRVAVDEINRRLGSSPVGHAP